jgi:hypothetical protein
MKATFPAAKKADAPLDARQRTTLRVPETVSSSSTKRRLNPIWRTDATIGSVLGALRRTTTAPSGD